LNTTPYIKTRRQYGFKTQDADIALKMEADHVLEDSRVEQGAEQG
jgi:hypothetical protein